MLMEHETQKIKELDEQYSNELREWKAMLVPRKQVNTEMNTRFRHGCLNVLMFGFNSLLSFQEISIMAT